MSLKPAEAILPGMKVTVMGLGLNGGGLESARYCASKGASVTVTDLRGPEILAPSIKALEGLPVRYVLGSHEMDDFSKADVVIKNPAVKPGSPFLAAARRIETDISLFLAACPSPLLAVTGSKGKSSTASSLAWVLKAHWPRTMLGGNITTSPLSFVDQLDAENPVVLELSSWQLGDLAGRGLLSPRVAIVTPIFPDHQDRYGAMEPYVADKRIIFSGQSAQDYTICFHGDEWGHSFAASTPAQPCFYGAQAPLLGMPYAHAWGDSQHAAIKLPDGSEIALFGNKLAVCGIHQRSNLQAAGLAAWLMGVPVSTLQEALTSYPGIAHRLEFVRELDGVRWYNDSAATIPQALAAAISSFDQPLHLITGGTDKELDFEPLLAVAGRPAAYYLLAGSATPKIQAILTKAGRAWNGPYDALQAAMEALKNNAAAGSVAVLSPGCASFGMFLNEFDRGNTFKRIAASF